MFYHLSALPPLVIGSLFAFHIFHDFCRITSDCLNNSFFSSALREWVEQVALGCFTTEYRARMRADEKKKASLRAEDMWKRKFFEGKWGDSW